MSFDIVLDETLEYLKVKNSLGTIIGDKGLENILPWVIKPTLYDRS